MKDKEQEDDWIKLITLQNIETATQNNSRLSMALHLAFLTKYLDSLEENMRMKLIQELQEKNRHILYTDWGFKFENFLEQGTKNATFALHSDMMRHCDEIMAISVAEKLGGPGGYNLFLATVKQSLPFSFLNGASSYAAFCVDPLYQHYAAGTFHQNMKKGSVLDTHRDGHVNIALDTQWEIDHKDAIKGFRPRSSIKSVIPSMTIVDRIKDTHKTRMRTMRPTDKSGTTEDNSQISEINEDNGDTDDVF